MTGNILKTKTRIKLHVNKTKHELDIDINMTLAEVLRDRLGLRGTKLGCNRGECGICTVMLNGRAVYSCTVLAVDADGGDVLTVEGLSYNNHLHPLQELFVEYDALQCGYCTPGFLMSLVSLFESGKRIGLDEIRESISGILCRCGAYPNIVKAALEYSKKFVNNNV